MRCAVVDVRVARRGSPLRVHPSRLVLGGKLSEPLRILPIGTLRGSIMHLHIGQQFAVIGAAVNQRVDQRVAVPGQIANCIALLLHRME